MPASTRKLILLRFYYEVNLVSKSQLITVITLQIISYYEHNTLWSKFRVIAASDSQSICALRYAWATRELHTICCLHERNFVLWLSRRWNRPRVSGHERERFLHRVARNYNRHRKSQVLLTRQRFFSNAIAVSESRLVWVTTLRERFSRIKNLRIALQKSRPCKCGFTYTAAILLKRDRGKRVSPRVSNHSAREIFTH